MQLEQPIAGYNGKPQTEDGYTRIANELFEAVIKFKFTERQYKVFFSIMRKTYGFNKTNDEISLSQLASLCELQINHVSTVINQLVALNIIIKKQGRYAQNLSINKQYDTWGFPTMECHKVELHIVEPTIPNLGVKGFPTMEPQKTTPKDNTKDICIECLNYLNEKSKKKFEPVEANLKLIRARLKEFSKEVIFKVIDKQTKLWIDDDFMKKYLRPATLFNAEKFAQYSGELEEQKDVPRWKREML